MSTSTPNLNLIQPAPAESGILTTYKTNNTAIDNAYGQYINDYQQSLENVAPVEGSTASKNYTVGQYLVKDGRLYKVTSAIASGENIVVGTNVTATSLNDAVVEVNGVVASLRDSVSVESVTLSAASSDVTLYAYQCYKIGRLVVATLNFVDDSPVSNDDIAYGFPAPSSIVYTSAASSSDAVRFKLKTNGYLVWDSTTSSSWTNMSFAYVAAS